jgi:hypothetical protein
MITQVHDFKSATYKTLWKDDQGTHFIVSTVNNEFGAETMIFPSSDQGKVTDFTNLFVVYDMNDSHVEVIKQFMSFLESKNGS